MDAEHVVVLGAGYAGQLAAARLARRRPNARLTVVDSSAVFVERIRLHQRGAGGRDAARPMTTVLPRGSRFVQGTVASWDVAAGLLAMVTNAGPTELSYDRCVYALGSRVDTSVPGVARNAYALDDPTGAARLADAVARGGRVLVVGAGLTGIEAAAEIAERHRGVSVTIVATGALGAGLSPAGASHVRQVFAQLGVQAREHVAVGAVEPNTAVLRSGDRIPFDVCLWSAGFAASSLARDAGLPVNERNQVKVDATLRVPGHPEIFVAGDAAEVAGADGRPLRMACATAMPMGAYAGDALAKAMAGEPIRPFRFAYKLRCISLGRRDGLIQFVDEQDDPIDRIWMGRRAAVVKEIVCRSTVLTIRAERRGMRLYAWPTPSNRARPLPQPAALAE